jgi:hypothetical protein
VFGGLASRETEVSFMRHALTASAMALLVAGCASTGATMTQKSKRRSKPRVEVGAIDDFSLTDQTTEETTYFLSVADDGVSTPLPEFAFSSSDAADDAIDAMFPAEPGTVDDAIGDGVKPSVRVFTVAAETAAVRVRPDANAAVVMTLQRGQTLAGLAEGRWARLGDGRFVDLRALAPAPGGAGLQQSKLGVQDGAKGTTEK